ncbi:MAG: ComEC/Rec2 family competence protein [Ekhidna sp.]
MLGVLCYDQNPDLWKNPLEALIVGIIGYAISVFSSHKFGFFKLRHINGCLGLLLIFYIGGYSVQSKYHTKDPSHYTNLENNMRGFSGVIVSQKNERKNHFRYDFRLDHIITRKDSLIAANGEIHLYIRKDSSNLTFQYGDQLNVYGRYFRINDPDNPGEFNYKQYLERQNIYSHAFVENHHVELVRNAAPSSLFQWAYSIRAHANSTIDKHIHQPRENGIAKALLLGIKDHLDDDLKKAYSAAGAMHVLAVSGLHVGIILLIIKLIFGKLRQEGKRGRYVFGLISLSIIWLYAIVTGLSPSVLRAATMFSMIALSDASSRESNIYNSLGLAAFILLLFDPYLIYSVGFQLSFAAVIGIVYLQPKLYLLLDFRHFLIDKSWMITCVSIAAQLSTFPLTAYYFHQFPTYFLISNLIVIPSSFLMLIVGICMLCIDPIIPVVGKLIGLLLQHFMWIVNQAITYVHKLPNSLIEWIYMDEVGLILTYSIVLTLIASLHYRTFKTLSVSAVLIIAHFSWTILDNETQARKNELVFYQIDDKIAIDHIEGHTAVLYINEVAENEVELLAHQINPNRLSSHLKPISETIIPLNQGGFKEKDAIHQGVIAGKRIIIIDSTTFHLEFRDTIEVDYIIINNGSVKNLNWLKNHFTFDRIIISPKNSIYYSRKMRKQATSLGLNIHSLKEEGALKISLKEGIKKERTI